VSALTGLRPVDHSALRTNQAVIITLSLLAFVFDSAWMAGLTAVVMLLGTLVGKPGFGFVYQRGLKPLGWLKPEMISDNPEPHRFAQGFGALVMLSGTAALLMGGVVLGWGLVWLVIALAALNLFAGFCVGCAMYYWLGKINFPGFVKRPPRGVIPGMKPTGDSK
jgi:membrane protein DedA with SNARE-associated domain